MAEHIFDQALAPSPRAEALFPTQARAQSFFNGFFDQSAELWNAAGRWLATTHQIVYFKE
jgi:hypothetical protein